MTNRTKFPVGRVVATPAALQALAESGQQPDFFLDRHSSGEHMVEIAANKVRKGMTLLIPSAASGLRPALVTKVQRNGKDRRVFFGNYYYAVSGNYKFRRQ